MSAIPTGTITFLFTDIEGSTTRWEHHPAAMRRALQLHDALLRQIITAGGGHVFKTVGDAVCAAFATAPPALAAALAAQRALRDTDWAAVGIDPLLVRMALHTGVADLQDGDYVGRPLNRIARVLATGHGGQILLTLATEQLVRDELPPGTFLRDLGRGGLRGLVHAEHVYQLVVPDLPSDFPPLTVIDPHYVEPLHADGVLVQNPYKGLRAFLAADAPDFFGREALTERLIERLGEQTYFARFLAVVGPSGSGKSSVVRAGLVPALRRGALPGSEHWRICELLPGTHPLEELEAALLNTAAQPLPTLLEQLQADSRGLIRAVKRVLPPDPAAELVLIIDQFEEVFTLVPDEAARVHFLMSLHAAVSDPRSRVRVVITLRADFYDRPLLYPDPGELLRQRTEVVLPLTAAELERAIVQPAARVGVQVEPELVATIIQEVGQHPGVLPLLQHALTELFAQRTGQTLTLAAYHAGGGVLGALPRRADEIYMQLAPSEQAAARQLFLRLITLGEGVDDTRRRVRRTELAAIANDQAVTEGVLAAFGHHRLLTFSQDALTYEPTVEVAHEALLRTWTRLQDWLAASRANLRLERQLLAAAHEWAAADHDPSFLATGTRLVQFEAMAQQGDVALTDEEHRFVAASAVARTQQADAERERLERELALQQRHAAALRRRAVYLVGALVVAILTATAAGAFARTAQANFVAAERVRLAAQATNLLAAGATGDLPALLALRSLGYGYSAQADAALLSALTRGFIRQRFVGHTADVFSVMVAPDGQTVLTASDDQTARLWDARTGQELRQFLGHTAKLWTATFSADGRYVLTASDDQTARLWDAQSGRELRQFLGHTAAVWSAQFSPDGTRIITTAGDKTARLWDVQTGKEVRQLKSDPSAHVFGAAFAPDGTSLLIVYQGGPARLWNTQTGQQLQQFVDPTQTMAGWGAVSPDGRYVLTGSDDGQPRLWDASSGAELHRLEGHTAGTRTVAFSPDGRYALTGSFDKTARLWAVPSGTQLRVLNGHTDWVLGVAFSPDGRSVLTSGTDRTVLLRDTTTELEPHPLNGHTDWVTSVAFAPDGRYALTGSADATARLWDAQSGTERRVLTGHTAWVSGVAFAPDGTRLLTGGEDGTARLWDVQSGAELRVLAGHTDWVTGVAFSPDGRKILTASADQTARLWDAATGTEVHTLHGHTAAVTSAAFSPDGRYLLTASGDKTARLWDARTGQIVQQYLGHTGEVHASAFSPDGRYVLTGGADRTVRLWETTTGQQFGVFTGHTDWVTGVVFSTDGQRVFTSSNDHTARMWDVRTQKEVRQFIGHSGRVWGVAVAPDGARILTAGDDGTARLWNVDYHAAIDLACAQLPHDLSADERALYTIRDNAPTCATR